MAGLNGQQRLAYKPIVHAKAGRWCESQKTERLEVILTLSDLFLPELTWSATPSSLYCVSWAIAFIEVGATTAIPKRLCKEMQYA